jgi:hypothetical protein
MAVSARLMRRILVDWARSRHYLKRRGEAQTVSLEEAPVVSAERGGELVALRRAVTRNILGQQGRTAHVPNTYLQLEIWWILGILVNRKTNKLLVFKVLRQNDSHSPPPNTLPMSCPVLVTKNSSVYFVCIVFPQIPTGGTANYLFLEGMLGVVDPDREPVVVANALSCRRIFGPMEIYTCDDAFQHL